jgi:hypothetical protein
VTKTKPETKRPAKPAHAGGPQEAKAAPEASTGEHEAPESAHDERPSLDYVDILELGDRFIACVEMYGRKYNLKEWQATAPVLRHVLHELESAPAIPESVAREIETMPHAAKELEGRRQRYAEGGKANVERGKETKRRVLELRDNLKNAPKRSQAAVIAKQYRQKYGESLSTRQIRDYLPKPAPKRK